MRLCRWAERAARTDAREVFALAARAVAGISSPRLREFVAHQRGEVLAELLVSRLLVCVAIPSSADPGPTKARIPDSARSRRVYGQRRNSRLRDNALNAGARARRAAISSERAAATGVGPCNVELHWLPDGEL